MPPLNLRADLEENLFDNNSKYEGSDSDFAYVNHRSARVFGKSSEEEMSCDEYLVRTKKTCGEKEGGKLKTTTNNDYGKYSSNISLNL